MRHAEPSVTEAINRGFRKHPIGRPLTLISIGLGLIGLWVFVIDTAPRMTFAFLVFVIGVGVLCFVIGVVMLPIGIVVAIRREKHKVVLRCPSCGLLATESDRPFRIQRLSHVEYSVVTCPRCKWDFTVDKYAKFA